jgi:hypothetical protein
VQNRLKIRETVVKTVNLQNLDGKNHEKSKNFQSNIKAMWNLLVYSTVRAYACLRVKLVIQPSTLSSQISRKFRKGF